MAEQFYTGLQGTASRLLGQFKQGTIIYRKPGTTSGPVFNPVITDPVDHVLDATAKGVSQEYVDGTQVLATDKEITSAVFGVTPDASGEIVVDGQVLQIVRLWQVPAAGVPVAWKFIGRA